MPILADQHMHTDFSYDSSAPMEEMIGAAVEKGLKHVAITEHNDFNYPVSEQFPKGCWDLNVDSYLYDLLTMREKFAGKATIGFGIEVGLQESILKENSSLTDSQNFDFVIGSVHLVNGVDTYDEKFYRGRTPSEAINEYFDSVLANINKFKNFDVLGHLDYLTRTLPGHEADYKPSDYKDKIDEILKVLVENNKGLELNTQTLGKGFKYPNPWPEVLKRFNELGGEIITIGSDAHKPEAIGAGFDVAEEILKDTGFRYYCVYHYRMPAFVRL